MHIELNSQQVTLIEDFIASKKLEYFPLEEELLDHLCCMIEKKMTLGANFQTASNEVFDTFKKDELQELEDQTIHLLNQKKLSMKKVSFLVLGLMMMTFTVIWAINIDPPSKSPLGEGFKITSQFGMRMHPVMKEKKMHTGIDFKTPIGTPVYATSDGIVEKVEIQKGGYGKHIVIRHDKEFQTHYAHLSEMNVKVGQKVKQGDEIGLTGSSGMSSVPHLHYEVIKNGDKVNPMDYFGP